MANLLCQKNEVLVLILYLTPPPPPLPPVVCTPNVPSVLTLSFINTIGTVHVYQIFLFTWPMLYNVQDRWSVNICLLGPLEVLWAPRFLLFASILSERKCNLLGYHIYIFRIYLQIRSIKYCYGAFPHFSVQLKQY